MGTWWATSVSLAIHGAFTASWYNTYYMAFRDSDVPTDDIWQYTSLHYRWPQSIWWQIKQFFLRAYSMLQYVQKVQPDVIISHQEEANIVSRLVCFLLWIKLYCVVHWNFQLHLSFFYRLVYKFCYRKTNLIAVSQWVASLLSKEWYTHLWAKVIYNRNRLLPVKQHFLVSSKTVIKALHVGNLIPVKQQYHLVDIGKLLIHRYINIAGDGYLYEDLQEKIIFNKLEHRIQLLWYQKDIVSLMKWYDVFLFTSAYEWFWLVLIEAMSQWLAVISYNTRYGPSEIMIWKHKNMISWYVKTDCGYLVERNNIQAFLQACNSYEALSNNEKQAMSDAAIKRSKLFGKDTLFLCRERLIS